ncbi:hypothetical protein BJV82DRAFT_670796 [Fennellomyces sp. T-0311]|nr:hypothetical protein BJV82DRAFT_670796 [Fennellomyces sp. T-0311]
MNPLAACTRRRQAIRLSDDESDDQDPRSSCLPWCFKTQRIALQDDTPDSRILDDYLDPNTTVGIEPLLAQHPTQSDEFANNAIFSSEPQRFLSRNPFATTTVAHRTDYFMEDDDAQFLSDHRISAVISDRVKINDESSSNPVTRIKTEEEEEREKRTSRTAEDYGSELLDVAAPKPERALDDTTASKDDDFAGRELDDFAADRELQDFGTERELDDIAPRNTDRELVDLSDSPPAQELKDFSHSPAERELQDFGDPPAERELQEFNRSPKVKGYDIPGERELDDFNPVAEQAPVLSSSPRELVDVPAIRSMSQPPSPKPNARDTIDEVSEAGSSGRRSSVAVVAQSILGDRLEDFTEKLAFIKKNIIMSLEDDDNWDDEQPPQQPKRRTSYDPLMSNGSSSSPERPQQHKRSSSLMEVAGKFMHQFNQAALENGSNNDPNADHRVFSPSSFFATLAGPETNHDREQPDHQHRHERHHRERPSAWPDAVPEEEEERDEEDEEDLFDFSKMIAMGKNVRHIGEDMVGNGLRMFNDMANRVKSANAAKQPGAAGEDDTWMLDRDAWM